MRITQVGEERDRRISSERVRRVGTPGGLATFLGRARPTGLYLALLFGVYGPARFLLDLLRTQDPRYLGWTPAQYAGVAMLIVGVAGLLRLAGEGAGPRRSA